MPGQIGKTPEYFSYSQMKNIVDAFEGKITKSVEKEKPPVTRGPAKDEVKLGEGMQDVLIIPGKSLMKSAKDINADKVAKNLTEKGIDVKDKLGVVSGVTAKVDSKDMEALKEQGYLVFDNSPRNLLPDVPQVTAYSGKGNAWDMPKIEDIKWTGTEAINKQGLTGKGEVIAIIDSGYQHPEKPLIAWKDMVDGYKKPVDPNGHGTHVAGDALKMAPDAELVGIRVMNGEGRGRPSDIIKGLQWAINNKEKYDIGTINMSLGGGPDGAPYYLDPINQAVAKAVDSGMVVVAAAGNSGPGSSTIGSPADAPSTLTVGSALHPEKLSDFSSRGPTDDNLVKPDVIAPGEFITSWAVPGSQLNQIATTVETIRRMTPSQLRKLIIGKPDIAKALGLPKDILKMDDKSLEKNVKLRLPPMYKPTEDTVAGPGTSFASPEVAGIVANLRQGHPDASPKEIKKALMDTADTMGKQYKTTEQGAGFVRADEAHEELSG
ncbi:MAG: S8 family serine peptidase [Candidatus Eremiobacteraeota bacterium]|nr:S8 family serine peptidase [Candidatus Eremiobacteraeota bacterium]